MKLTIDQIMQQAIKLHKEGKLHDAESFYKEFNFNLSHFEKIKLRKEKDFFIMGGLYLLDF